MAVLMSPPMVWPQMVARLTVVEIRLRYRLSYRKFRDPRNSRLGAERGRGAERAEHILPDAEWRGTGPSQGGAECADPVADQNAIRKSSIIRSLALRAIEGTTDHILIYIDSGDDSQHG